MTTKALAVWSPDLPTPRQVDLVKSLLAECGYHPESAMLPSDRRYLLVFGNETPHFANGYGKVVNTYSLSQLGAKSDSLTAITAAIADLTDRVDRPGFLDAEPSPNVHFFTRQTLGDILDVYQFDKSRDVVIDIETSGLLGTEDTPEDINVLTVTLLQDDLVQVFAFAHESGNLLEPGTVVYDYVRGYMDGFEKIIAHNGKFDLRVLNRVLDLDLTLHFDTMLAHHALYQAAKVHGLKPLAMRYFGAVDWEHDIKQILDGKKDYSAIPMQKLIQYNVKDVLWTNELYYLFSKLLCHDKNATTAFELEMLASNFLMDVEVTGIPFDADAADSLRAESEDKAAQLLAALQVVTGIPGFKPNSPKQVKTALENRGYTVSSTNEATLIELRNRESTDEVTSRFLENLLNYRKLMKISATYASGWASKARHGRIHPTFLIHGTTTGRLSSTQPNVQNMPRDKTVRKIVGE